MKLQEFIGKMVRDIVYDNYHNLVIWFTDNTKLLVYVNLLDDGKIYLRLNAVVCKEENIE